MSADARLVPLPPLLVRNQYDTLQPELFPMAKGRWRLRRKSKCVQIQTVFQGIRQGSRFRLWGGFLLSQLICRERIGIEINASARDVAGQLEVKCFYRVDLVDDEWADVIISNSALEQTHSPLDELKALYRKLRNGGTIVFGVPHEPVHWKFSPGDINQHLFTWSPMSIGNLFQEAGFTVDRVSTERRVWPPLKERILELLGERAFGLVCYLCWGLRGVRTFGVIVDIVVVGRKSGGGKPVSGSAN